MSLPQRPLLASPAVTMDSDKPRLGSGVFPAFNSFLAPTSSPSLFPANFPANMNFFAQFYNQFLQNQMLLSQNSSAQQSPTVPSDLSPISDETSGQSESPSVKKLQLDENGCPICPLCNEKVTESKWEQHVKEERENLVTIIGSVKCHKLAIEPQSSGLSTSISNSELKKRELELSRIRNNQQKRLNLKRGIIGTFRDSLTPYSRQSNEESGTSESPEMIKKEDDSFSSLKCAVCQSVCEFAIVTSSTDRPRCQQCFGATRILASALNFDNNDSSPTQVHSRNIVAGSPAPSSSSATFNGPPEKKFRPENQQSTVL